MNSITLNDYVAQIEPRRWPFPPSRPVPGRSSQPARPAPRPASLDEGGSVQAAGLRRDGDAFQGATRRQIVADALMVTAWAVLIPGGLWLGHWLGF